MSKRRREQHHEEHPDESWLLPYSDLMTLLLALFIVLYSVSAVNTSKLEALSQAFKTAFSSGVGILDHSTILDNTENNKKTEDTKRNKDKDKEKDSSKSQAALQQEEQQNLEQLQKQLDKYIEKNGLSSQLETQLNQSELLITIRDTALFSSASATVKPEAQKLATAIAQMLEGYSDYEIQVTGHTDTRPINTLEFPSNWELSTKRAINFMKILLENTSFDPKKFSAIGKSEYQPIDTNDTVTGRDRNRRVEISILRKYVEPTNPENELSVETSTVSQ
ncbi:MAG: flagellar motor protein MotB [Candidatus Cohnella colombiensis]|uniref:Flagellar motor protein MotB n=1 Tax=Candidatus Cohnella colombiensis TaxID=3121368 RepID=A0AA95F3W1_9BACL|nr:MAG: flagellar motor protein MotB [Cohnella sp.]